ncbi:GGDEF domain-containing protein [Patescibacteria group bacterium]|nr:GGDEF domain-containing protein [Patescibacteria group bacterium]
MQEALGKVLADSKLFKEVLTVFLQKRNQVIEALSALLEQEPQLREEEPMLEVLLYALQHGDDLFNDPLTEVRDRRLLKAGVYRGLLAEAQRDNAPLSAVIVDINDFKVTNDVFGHTAGDRTLKEVASILSREARRGTDVVIRYGGDEFLLILPHTDRKGASALMERVTQALGALVPKLSVSFGISSWVPGSEPIGLTEMAGEADEAMYVQKRVKSAS